MILIGTVMAIVAGIVVAFQMLLLGEVLNQFVYYEVSLQFTQTIHEHATQLGVSCEEFVELIRGSNINITNSTITDIYFCADTQNVIFGKILNFACDPDCTFFREISTLSFYYVLLAAGVFVSIFGSVFMWNVSGYRQTTRMRKAFYYSVLHQEIGWFDTTDGLKLTTNLAA